MTNSKEIGKKIATGCAILAGGFFFLVILLVVASTGGNESSSIDQEQSEEPSFHTLARERFDTIEASWKEDGNELENIECYNDSCNSVVYFNFNTIPEDFDFIIRANTATYSKFKDENGFGSHVSVFGVLNGQTIFQCDGSKGVVDECK